MKYFRKTNVKASGLHGRVSQRYRGVLWQLLHFIRLLGYRYNAVDLV